MSKNAATTPLEYQNASSEVYDLCKSSTGISISPDSSGVQHVFHVMEKDSVASMVLAADTASDAERWVYTLREILRIGRARNIEMPQDDATLNRLFELVLKNLALPAAKQKEMMGTLPRKQKKAAIRPCVCNRRHIEKLCARTPLFESRIQKTVRRNKN